MNNKLLIWFGFVVFFLLGIFVSKISNSSIASGQADEIKDNLKIGAFSVSLNVKDIAISKEFYESLGFSVLAGDLKKDYLIMKNENSLIGMFHGMFEGNILTFNPGWDENGNEKDPFDDIREIQHKLKNKGIDIGDPIDEKSSGPASFMISDPDGNIILFDQHR